jgi:hypothetical protein
MIAGSAGGVQQTGRPKAVRRAVLTGTRRSSDRAELAQLSLRRVRPALRFNTGPLLEPDATGRLVPTGQEVLQAYVSYGDEAD